MIYESILTVVAPRTGTISANALNVAETTSSLLSLMPVRKIENDYTHSAYSKGILLRNYVN